MRLPLLSSLSLVSLASLCVAVPAPGRVLVVGGSGRVGGSTVRWLRTLSSRENLPLTIAVGGRSRRSFERAVAAGVVPPGVEFVEVDVDGPPSALDAAVDGCSLVVHTAGPFQGRTDPALLRASLERSVPYVDVCDEWELAKASKGDLHAVAVERGVPAVVSAGIWPGVSALMAAEAVQLLGGDADAVDFSFYTAGTGNAGPTIVSATFLLLAAQALTFKEGAADPQEPWTSPRSIDFGEGVGMKPVWLLDNPDVPTCHAALGVRSLSSRFGTAPLFWNYLFGAMKAVPRSLLQNQDAMQAFALFSEPIIRFVDRLVGATNAMRVDAKAGGKQVTLRIAHPDLEQCVGLATAAFALELVRGRVRPGVWYPAELEAPVRASILAAAREDSFVYEVNGPHPV